MWKRLRKFSTGSSEFQTNVESFIQVDSVLMMDGLCVSKVMKFVLRLIDLVLKMRRVQELPLVLREEISLFLHKSMVQKVPIFNGCAESFLSDIVVHLRPQVNMPDEVIIDIGGIGDRMFFLSSGAIEILIESGRSVRMLQSGDYMGEFALITGERRSAAAVARSFVLLHVLLKADFERIMAAWPEYETRMAEACEQRLMSAVVAVKDTTEDSGGNGNENADAQKEEEADGPAQVAAGAADGGGTTPRRIRHNDGKASAAAAASMVQHLMMAVSRPDTFEWADDDAAADGSETAHCDEPPLPSNQHYQGADEEEEEKEDDAVSEEGGKEVAAIRTILAGHRRQFSNSGAPTSTAGALDDDEQVPAAAQTIVVKPKPKPKDKQEDGVEERYRFTQPNEPESEQQWLDDAGNGRRSQGSRFERGHSQRFSELCPPRHSQFSSQRGSSGLVRMTGRTTVASRPGSSAAVGGMRRGGRMLGEMGGNGTMKAVATHQTSAGLAAKIDAVGNESARNYAQLAQGMQEMQAALALALAVKQ